jgi:NosR/NirI family transcriptional regulator, nitrous oxide reductase regulator
MKRHSCKPAGRALAWLIVWLAFACIAPPSALASGGAYQARLPEGVDTASDLCALVPCSEVFPGATQFSERKGQPPYVEAYVETDGRRTLIGYVMLSTDITDIPAYSGKPVVTLIGMDTNGEFVGVKVLKHSEPILLLGIPESALVEFNDQYIGKSVADAIEVGHARRDDDVIGVDAISGATVTVIAQNQVIMTAGSAIARQVGILPPTVREPARFTVTGKRYSWDELRRQGSVKRLRVRPEQAGLPPASEPFIELWFGDLNHPDIGRSVLGERGWENLRTRLDDGDHALFVIRTAGSESFKGSGFVRGGIYDRVQVRQGSDGFTFRDLDYLNLYGLEAEGAPRHTESAIFIIRSPSFSAAYPWRLSLLGNRIDRASGARSFTTFDSEYWLAASLLDGGRPKVHKPPAPWQRIWSSRAVEIALFAGFLLAVGVIYGFRDRLARRATRRNKWPVNAFRYPIWVISIGVVGFGLMAQPSITQVLTWFHSLLFNWTWSLFLSDPFIFLFWIFIIVTVFLFGRGLFCGWLCPFGSLSEVLHKFAAAIGLKRFQRALPQVWHDRLKWLKYVIFFGLLAVSVVSMTMAEVLAEIEPFKTTFLVGVQNRAWPYGLFVILLLTASMFFDRPYCKYLCPLGAALAVPSTFRWFALPRKQECNRCKTCAVGCGSQAIDAAGRIDPRECLHCLDCLVLYTEPRTCPPLSQERKRRERTGQPLTAINREGYFIPVTLIDTPLPAVASGPDPRMPSEPVTLSHKANVTAIKWLLLEMRDHLWPWSRAGWRSQRALQVAGFSLAIAVTIAWALAANGQLSAAAIIGWWFGWSVYEVVIRLSGRRYVKEGPWWQDNYREASVMDMLSYVAFKNLLIGAALFLTLKALGLLWM